MGRNPLVKRKSFLFLILFAISLSFLFLQVELKSCPFKYESFGIVLKSGKIYGNERKLKRIKTELVDYGHMKLKILRKKSKLTIEFQLNPKNVSKVERSGCNEIGLIDQSISKKEMFDFYEMKKIE
jgi:hypothetical protein